MVSKNLRGMFVSALAFSISLGIQFVVVLGELTPDWRMTTIACMAPSLIGKIKILFLPTECATDLE
jgi:hypothetical protein